MNVLIMGGEHPLAALQAKYCLDMGDNVRVLLPRGRGREVYEKFEHSPRLSFSECMFYRTPYYPDRGCYEEVYSFVAAEPLTTFKVVDIVNAAQAHMDIVDLCGVDSLFVLTSPTNDEMFQLTEQLTGMMLMERRLMQYTQVGADPPTPEFLQAACRGFPKPEGEDDADE
jgi:hypothetical protein